MRIYNPHQSPQSLPLLCASRVISVDICKLEYFRRVNTMAINVDQCTYRSAVQGGQLVKGLLYICLRQHRKGPDDLLVTHLLPKTL